MSCDKVCTNGKKSFTFSTSRKTFENAKQACENAGGSLAADLDDSDYSLLNSCCDSQNQYWIGLLNKPNGCRYRNVGQQYQWVNSGECKSAKPLHITTQPNNRRCQAVTIAVTTLDEEFPRAYETDCVSSQRYICQISTPKIEAKPSDPSRNDFPLSSTGAATTTDILSPKISSATLNVAALVGGILGFISLLLLIAIVYQRFCKSKRSKERNESTDHHYKSSSFKPTSLPSRSPSQKSCHIYCTIPESLEMATKLDQKERCKSHEYIGSQLKSPEGYQTIQRPLSVHLDCYVSQNATSDYEVYVLPYETIDNNNDNRSPHTGLKRSDSYIKCVRPL